MMLAGMRIAVAKLGFSLLVAALTLVSCRAAGVRYVIMSINTDGTDPRSVFFVDSKNITCVAKMTVADPDTYVESVLLQHGSVHWDDTSTSNTFPLSPPDHPLFAAQEIKAGTGTEQTVSFSLNTTGTGATVPCLGNCVVNPPPGTDPCYAGYTYQGPDSCGFGAACCFNPFMMSNMQMQSVLPYPPGTYECQIFVNGEFQGSAQFSIQYDCASQPSNEGPGPCCPTIPPSSGVPCRNWVPKGTSCRGYATASTICDCNNYYWECHT
jgi:hypothetical protein